MVQLPGSCEAPVVPVTVQATGGREGDGLPELLPVAVTLKSGSPKVLSPSAEGDRLVSLGYGEGPRQGVAAM